MVALATPDEGELLYQGIACEVDHSGYVWRLWAEFKLLGTFWRAEDGSWRALPCCDDVERRCVSARMAQLKIVAVWEEQEDT